MEQRAARRKSMANRRVSFAPEATLHTWSVIQLAEDSTTSSASNSTRRQSSITAAQSPKVHVDDLVAGSGRPSTPVEQEVETVPDTPESQRNLHQRKRRRTSDVAQTSDDETFSSPGDGAESSPIRVEDSIDSESDTDGDTTMSLDEGTQNTIRSSDSSSTQTSLDERLRLAATQAGTRGIQYDEDGTDDDNDQSMEIANGTITHAFKQYDHVGRNQVIPDHDGADKENINQFQLASHSEDNDAGIAENDVTMGLTMDMTHAIGGIVPRGSTNEIKEKHKTQRSNSSRRRSSGVNTSYSDETMDLTVAKGGILSTMDPDDDVNEQESDEEMTMEMTNVLGGLKYPTTADSTISVTTEDTESMEMTMAAGSILPPIEEQTEPQSFVEDGVTSAMEMTRAVGRILPEQYQKVEYPSVETLTQEQTETKPKLATATTPVAPQQMAPAALETGSPTLKPRLSSRKSAPNSRSTTPKSAVQILSPTEPKQVTPSKQLTPAPAKGTSPERTPILSSNVAARGISPKKLFAKEILQRASPSARKSPRKHQDLLFSTDKDTGTHTPRVVLHAPKPHQHLRRRSSGLGISNDGTGSPRVSEILSRRISIGDEAQAFQLQSTNKQKIQFVNLEKLEQEIDAERAEEQRRESGRFIMEQEAVEEQEETTVQNLREMIQSMTPKKESKRPTTKGRKSLAVGSAKGLLGKRPAELDDEDDDDDRDSTSKRLKSVSREGSPVKKVHLPKPPTKEETTGRLSKAEVLQLASVEHADNTPTISQVPFTEAKSPERTGRFKETLSTEKPTSFELKLDNVVDAIDVSTAHPDSAQGGSGDEKISLQQFLNMTNVHFIELSTTKRRHTIAPSLLSVGMEESSDSSQPIFVAGATTLPLLELYQHATRELKSYISSGRKIIRQIEAETLIEQPAIFKEYLDARPDIKVAMDNQFRNGKMNARLQSKEGWYNWRGQLVDGLQNGLEGIQAEMEKDKKVLIQQQHSLNGVLPQYIDRKQRLDGQVHDLRRQLNELDSVDHATLRAKRQELAKVARSISQRQNEVDTLDQQLLEKREILSQAAELRQEMIDQISEAARVQEEQRRWHSKDVKGHKTAVEKLEQESGWKLLMAEEDTDVSNDLGVALTLRYQDELRLLFYPSAFQPKHVERRKSGRNSRSVSGPTAPISLTYTPDAIDEQSLTELSTEFRFFLQLIQSQLHAYTMMPKGTVSNQEVLRTVSEGWRVAQNIASEIRSLGTAGVVRVSIMSDEKLCAKMMMMLPDRSRVDIEFMLTAMPLKNGEMLCSTNITAKAVYGLPTTVMDISKTRKVQHALMKEVESHQIGEASWLSAVRGFEVWLHGQIHAKTDVYEQKPSGKVQQLATTKPITAPTTNEAKEPPRHSPQHSVTPKVPARSPLAPRTTNSRVQKKALPVPKKPSQLNGQAQHDSQIPILSQQKENCTSNSFKNAEPEVIVTDERLGYDDVFGGAKPAIPPEMQEAMMHTPVKRRVGALRRSPI